MTRPGLKKWSCANIQNIKKTLGGVPPPPLKTEQWKIWVGDEIWFLNVSNHVLFLLFNYVSRIHKASS